MARAESSIADIDSSRYSKLKSGIAKGQEAGAWQFVNLSTPQHIKDSAVRKVIRSNAAKRYQSKASSERQTRRTHQPILECALQRPVSASYDQCTDSSRRCGDDLGVSSIVPDVLVWPNQLDQLVIEAAELCSISSPIASSDDESVKDRTCTSCSDASSFPLSPIISPQCPLGSGSLDPFDAFPVQDCTQDSEFVTHCKFRTSNKESG